MNKHSPLVSVIMAVYNSEKYLSEAINSILRQTIKDLELIIINDGSSDNSLRIINSFKDARIVIVNQANRGASNARNSGFGISRGKFIAIMDSDDITMENRFEKQIAFMNDNSKCVVLGSNAVVIDEGGGEIYYTNFEAEEINRKTNEEIKYYLLHSSVMMRKDAVLSVGGYKEYLTVAEDKILFVDLGKRGDLRIINDILIQYRYSPHSVSMIQKKVEKQINRYISSYEKNNFFTKQDLELIKRINKSLKYQLPYRFKLSRYYFNIGNAKLECADKYAARTYLHKAMKLDPLNIHNVFFLALSFLPNKTIRLWKNYRTNRIRR